MLSELLVDSGAELCTFVTEVQTPADHGCSFSEAEAGLPAHENGGRDRGAESWVRGLGWLRC
jgi:hypothetical protein